MNSLEASLNTTVIEENCYNIIYKWSKYHVFIMIISKLKFRNMVTSLNFVKNKLKKVVLSKNLLKNINYYINYAMTLSNRSKCSSAKIQDQ